MPNRRESKGIPSIIVSKLFFVLLLLRSLYAVCSKVKNVGWTENIQINIFLFCVFQKKNFFFEKKKENRKFHFCSPYISIMWALILKGWKSHNQMKNNFEIQKGTQQKKTLWKFQHKNQINCKVKRRKKLFLISIYNKIIFIWFISKWCILYRNKIYLKQKSV